VVAITREIPNCLSGASASANIIVAQLGLVAICPFHPRRRCCSGMIFK
jgi:hypothetical protein